MKQLVIHERTQQLIDAYVAEPAHAALLTGPSGSGKGSLAQAIMEEALALDAESFSDYAYGAHIAPEKKEGSIGIEEIRSLERFLSLRVPRDTRFNRGIIIEHADQLTTEAQNALLKTLEEPPEGTLIVLTASRLESLLPTIASRVQTISVQRPEKDRVVAHFSQQFPNASIKQVHAIGAGLPGLMNSLLEEEEHPLFAATENARKILQQTTYERLLLVDALAKDRDLARDTVYILQQMAHVSLQSATGVAAKRWQGVLRASHDALDALRSSAQPKLALTNLMLQL